MALIKDYYQPQYQVTIAGCYWKIEVDNGIWGGKTKLHARLNCFKNQSINRYRVVIKKQLIIFLI